MDEQVEQAPKRRHVARAVVASAVVAALVTAGLATAVAQTPSETPSKTPPAPGERGQRAAKLKGLGRGPGFGALHGEFTTRAPGGGYQVLAMQRGEVKAVSASSITVESEDGFERAYAVNDDTMVGAGDEGIADVVTGDIVQVIAVIDGDDARAVRIDDVTQRRRLGQKWRPHRIPKERIPQDG